MVRTLSSSSTSSSSCASFGSFHDLTVKTTVKFLCSYGGRIVPRHSDGKLRYVGGDTRVLAVDKSIHFSELQVKLRDLCGWESVSLRCQLPTDDLYDALVSITSDEDLANFLEEFNLAIRDRLHPLKIIAFLFPQPSKTPKPLGPSPTSTPSASIRERETHRPISNPYGGTLLRPSSDLSAAPLRFSHRSGRDPRVHGFPIAHWSTWPHRIRT